MPQTREKARESSLRYYYANKEKIAARLKARYWSDPEKARAKRREEYHANEAENARWRRLKQQFGLTKGEYLEMLAEQGGVCAVCKKSDPSNPSGKTSTYSFAVDHNHRTGIVRGLLCKNCNLLLGNAKDDPSVLESAVTYLQERGR